MIIPEKKKAVRMILSKFGKPGVEKMPHLSEGGELKTVGKSEMPNMEAKGAHMQAMIAAIHNHDHEAAVQHMDSFLSEHELHAEKEKEDESKDMEPSDKE